MSEIPVMRTHKLFIAGAFSRSESGRTFELKTPKGDFIANMAKASKKDARDAVSAARTGFTKWSAATSYNRGQVLYRVAEIMQGRSEQFASELILLGASKKEAASEVAAAIDAWVWYAGWSDKLATVTGSANPVAGSYFNFSIPEPTGIVVVIPKNKSPLYSLVEAVAAAIVSGNSTIAICEKSSALIGITLAEVLATSDVPAGVVNILTGEVKEIAPALASHLDVNALDLSGVNQSALATELEAMGAQNLKRILRPVKKELDGLSRIKTWLETKTVWHPRGY